MKQIAGPCNEEIANIPKRVNIFRSKYIKLRKELTERFESLSDVLVYTLIISEHKISFHSFINIKSRNSNIFKKNNKQGKTTF